MKAAFKVGLSPVFAFLKALIITAGSFGFSANIKAVTLFNESNKPAYFSLSKLSNALRIKVFLATLTSTCLLKQVRRKLEICSTLKDSVSVI